MGRECEIYLEKKFYKPGETINGKVKCIFLNNCTVRGIKITFSGKAKVYWKQGKVRYQDKKEYFTMESNLLRCETKFEPGHYEYPFNFNLPGNLPSTMKMLYGSVKYKADAVVDIGWALGYKSQKIFNVYCTNYLSMMEGLNAPVECTKEKVPFSIGRENPIKLTVKLMKDCFAPNQMVVFVATVRNASSVTVSELRFQIVQSFTFHVRDSERESIGSSSQEFAVINSVVNPGEEKYWNLELRVPADMFIGTLQNCECIRIHWQLRGVLCLPFPHRNMSIEVPLLLGAEDSPRPVS